MRVGGCDFNGCWVWPTGKVVVRKRQTKNEDTVNYIKDLAEDLRAMSDRVDAATLRYLLDMVVHESKALLSREETAEQETKAASIETQRLYMTDKLDD
jgi:ubiquinone/menaquinone biosynthesis C-methylase UbiE